MIKRALTVALLALTLVACDQEPKDDKVVKRPGQPDYVRSEDPALIRAYAKAKSTHKDFVAALQSPKATQRGFAIKKPYNTPKGSPEHIWINEVSWDGSKFTGKINNEPVETKAVKLGDRVTVTPDELTDWMYVDGRKLVGGYTLRVLHFQQSAEDQATFTKKTGIEVPPVDF